MLELGGNDPIIVMEDADLDEGGRRSRPAGSYKNSGQRCTAVKRMLVHEAVADRFVELLLEKTRGVKYGDPLDPDDRHGHGDRRAPPRCCSSDASTTRSRRARSCCTATCARRAVFADGGRPRAPEMKWCARRPSARCRRCIRFKDVDDAIRDRQLDRLRPVVRRVHQPPRLHHALRARAAGRHGQCREVPGYRLELTPFGGIKDSGLGYKEGVQEAMKSFTNVKTYSLPW